MSNNLSHFLRSYYSKTYRKLWPKAPAKDGALSEMSTNFQVYCNINFLRNQKKMYNRVKELFCDPTIFAFDSLLSSCSEKMEIEKWKLNIGT